MRCGRGYVPWSSCRKVAWTRKARPSVRGIAGQNVERDAERLAFAFAVGHELTAALDRRTRRGRRERGSGLHCQAVQRGPRHARRSRRPGERPVRLSWLGASIAPVDDGCGRFRPTGLAALSPAIRLPQQHAEEERPRDVARDARVLTQSTG